MRESVTRAEGADNTEAAGDKGVPSRRNFLAKTAAVSGAVGAVLVIGEVAKSLVKTHRAAHAALDIFGTIDNPVFKVDTSLPFSKLETYKRRIQDNGHCFPSQLVEQGNAAVPMVSNLLNDEIVRYREGMKNAALSPAEKVAAHERFFGILSVIDKELRAILSPITTFEASVDKGRLRDQKNSEGLSAIYFVSIEKSFKEKAGNLGPPDVFVRGLVKKLTGKDLPAWVRPEVRPVDQKGLVGFSDFVTREVVAKDRAYEGVVATFAHEVGHVISMHQEAFETGRGPTVQDAKDVPNWEEACAYAFEATVASYLATTDLDGKDLARNLFLFDYRRLTDAYYTGEEVNESHHVGMVYFDAALTVLGSPGAAYNYLSSHTELSHAMLAVIEENKKASKVDSKGRVLLRQKLTALLERVEKTREEYKVPGAS